jgi:hypothetical protein
VSDYALVIEGSPLVFGTAGVTSITSYTDAVPTGATLARILGPVEGTLTERLRPLDGDCEISALDFVLHDSDGEITSWFTRSMESTSLAYLTASVTAAASTATVNSAAALGTLPRDVWVADECWSVTSIAAGNTVNVTRARYGSPQGVIEVNADRAELPELFSYPCWMRGRRAKLYRVTGTSASLMWVGYVSHGPALAENGASYTVSCVSSWEQESRATWGSPQPAATLSGYDASAIIFTVWNDSRSIQVSSAFADYRAHVFRTRQAAVNASLERLAAQLTAAGASGVIADARDTGTDLFVTVQFQTVSKGAASLLIGGEAYEATSTDSSGYVEHIWRVPLTDGGAIVRAGFALGSDQRATTVTPHAGASGSAWATIAGSRTGTRLTPVLTADLGDDSFLELDPSSQADPGFEFNDATFTTLGNDTLAGVTTFHGFARVVSRDPTVRPVAEDRYSTARRGLPILEALPLRSELRVTSEHWLEALRSIVEDTTYATAGSDSRNWGWSGYAATLRRSRDDLGVVEYRTGGNVTVGEFITGEAKLRGCCVGVDANGKLTIVDIRAPSPAETPAATITLADLLRGSRAGYAPSEDGLVTEVVFETPLRTFTLRDAVALGRYRTQRAITVTSQSTRQDPRLTADPIGYAMLACGKLLGRWRNELWLHSLQVVASQFASTCTLGAVVSFESFSTPDRAGARGFTGASARRGVVIGRVQDLATGSLTLDVLELPYAYGFAPCARVASISGKTLTLASAYAGDAGDYAGSGLTGYAKTANDKGAGWFAAGDKVQLVLRNTASYTVESYTVASVNTVAGTIELTANVATVPTDWPALAGGDQPVDVIFDGWSTALSSQRVFAAVGDETTRQIASTSSNLRWSA